MKSWTRLATPPAKSRSMGSECGVSGGSGEELRCGPQRPGLHMSSNCCQLELGKYLLYRCQHDMKKGRPNHRVRRTYQILQPSVLFLWKLR
jgi:hypothetical protein